MMVDVWNKYIEPLVYTCYVELLRVCLMLDG
jgi:hypothetical protein